MARNRTLLLLVVVLLLLPVTTAHGDPSERASGGDAMPDPAPAVGRRAEPAPAAPVAVSPLPEGFVPGSTYGVRVSPRTGRRTFHAGADFLAPRGTSVVAVRAGVVEQVTRNTLGRTRFGGYGRSVVVYHPDVERWSYYAHLDSVTVRPGQTLAAGEALGTVGNSCNQRFRDMPTHLHFEVRSAAPGGRSPFPGAYRAHNEDPVAWLESMGVTFVRAAPEGEASVTREREPALARTATTRP